MEHPKDSHEAMHMLDCCGSIARTSNDLATWLRRPSFHPPPIVNNNNNADNGECRATSFQNINYRDGNDTPNAYILSSTPPSWEDNTNAQCDEYFESFFTRQSEHVPTEDEYLMARSSSHVESFFSAPTPNRVNCATSPTPSHFGKHHPTESMASSMAPSPSPSLSPSLPKRKRQREDMQHHAVVCDSQPSKNKKRQKRKKATKTSKYTGVVSRFC
jgi:hypothetical protein